MRPERTEPSENRPPARATAGNSTSDGDVCDPGFVERVHRGDRGLEGDDFGPFSLVAPESSSAPPRRANYTAIRARSDFRAFRRSSTEVPAKVPEWQLALDWPAAGAELARGTTIKQLHQELAPQVTYASFRRRLLASVPRPVSATVRIEHKPGEQTQIDYCDGITVVDRATGECKKTHLFCGVLPFSVCPRRAP